MSPESSSPDAKADAIVPPPTPAGAGSPEATTTLDVPPPAGATQIAALIEFGGFVKATSPLSFRKALVPAKGLKVVPVVAAAGLQAPDVGTGTNVSVPSLAPIKS